MQPSVLRAIVRQRIEAEIAWGIWQRCEVAEAAERESTETTLRRLLGTQ
jgi:hypothetical protein